MKYGTVEWSILVRGRPIVEYLCDGEVFVEGRDGSDYEIEVRNHSASKVEAVLSVDGLSVTDGKPAGPVSRGYLIAPRSAVRVPGWTVDSATAAAFVFAGRHGQSYVDQAGGDAANRGVLGLLIYAEQPAPPVPPVTVWNAGNLTLGAGPLWNATQYGSFTTATSDSSWVGAVGSAGTPIGGSMPNVANAAQAYAYATGQSAESLRSATRSATATEQPALGTGFGDSTAFHTCAARFRRGAQMALLSIRYDSAKALRARGIDVRRPVRQTATPNPFPALPVSGCTPPPGWHR